jgi:hypothetical protein
LVTIKKEFFSGRRSMDMEVLKDILLVYGRIFTILPLLLMATLFMGKRSIGELPVLTF